MADVPDHERSWTCVLHTAWAEWVAFGAVSELAVSTVRYVRRCAQLGRVACTVTFEESQYPCSGRYEGSEDMWRGQGGLYDCCHQRLAVGPSMHSECVGFLAALVPDDYIPEACTNRMAWHLKATCTQIVSVLLAALVLDDAIPEARTLPCPSIARL